jgi:hypothetical protein
MEKKSQNKAIYCSIDHFRKHNCNGCSKSGICDLFYMLLEYGAFEDEAKSMCQKLERRNNLGDVE